MVRHPFGVGYVYGRGCSSEALFQAAKKAGLDEGFLQIEFDGMWQLMGHETNKTANDSDLFWDGNRVESAKLDTVLRLIASAVSIAPCPADCGIIDADKYFYRVPPFVDNADTEHAVALYKNGTPRVSVGAAAVLQSFVDGSDTGNTLSFILAHEPAEMPFSPPAAAEGTNYCTWMCPLCRRFAVAAQGSDVYSYVRASRRVYCQVTTCPLLNPSIVQDDTPTRNVQYTGSKDFVPGWAVIACRGGPRCSPVRRPRIGVYDAPATTEAEWRRRLLEQMWVAECRAESFTAEQFRAKLHSRTMFETENWPLPVAPMVWTYKMEDGAGAQIKDPRTAPIEALELVCHANSIGPAERLLRWDLLTQKTPRPGGRWLDQVIDMLWEESQACGIHDAPQNTAFRLERLERDRVSNPFVAACYVGARATQAEMVRHHSRPTHDKFRFVIEGKRRSPIGAGYFSLVDAIDFIGDPAHTDEEVARWIAHATAFSDIGAKCEALATFVYRVYGLPMSPPPETDMDRIARSSCAPDTRTTASILEDGKKYTAQNPGQAVQDFTEMDPSFPHSGITARFVKMHKTPNGIVAALKKLFGR